MKDKKKLKNPNDIGMKNQEMKKLNIFKGKLFKKGM